MLGDATSAEDAFQDTCLQTTTKPLGREFPSLAVPYRSLGLLNSRRQQRVVDGFSEEGLPGTCPNTHGH